MTKFGHFDKNLQVVTDLEVDLDRVQSSDPLAYAYGFSAGKQWREKGRYPSGEPHGNSKFSELAPEYLRGFLYGFKGLDIPEGTKIRKGQELCFALSQLARNK